MKPLVKKIVIIVAVFFAVLGIYFGAYLPYKKANAFIGKIRLLQSVKSIDELKFHFNEVLGMGSPVAQDEIVTFTLDQLSNVIREDLPEAINRSITDYTEEVASSVLENPRSAELTKTYLKMGIIYQKNWLFYKDPVFAAKAEDMYLKGLAISPNRPQFLYGLFDLYLSGRRMEEAKSVGEKILGFWPNDSLMEEKLRILTAL